MMRAATRWDASRWRNGGRAVLMLCAVAALSFQSGGSPAAAPIAVAVFDYFDTSGEVTDQSAEHLARVAGADGGPAEPAGHHLGSRG